MNLQNLPLVATIKLGTGFEDSEDIRHALRKRKKIIDIYAEIGVLGKDLIKISPVPKEVDLVEVPLKLLLPIMQHKSSDGTNVEMCSGTYEEICAAALRIGLELCPNEVIPQIVLQCGVETFSFSVWKAGWHGEMRLVIDPDHAPLSIHRYNAGGVNPEGRFYIESGGFHKGSSIAGDVDCEFVFIRPRKGQ